MSMAPIILSDDLRKKLHLIAEKSHKTESSIISDALNAYFSHHLQQDKLTAETQIGLDDIKAGRIIDGNEVFAWLDTWGSPSEPPLNRP